MSTLHIDVQPGAKPDVTVLVLHGPLLIAHVPAFQQTARQAVTAVTVVDFSDSSYMDSAGLGALLQLYRQLLAQQRRLVVVGLNQRVAALLKLTRAETVLDVKASSADV